MTSPGEALRLFIAVELPDEVKQALAKEQQRLQARIGRAQSPGVQHAVRWVAPEGIHLTLKFLGSTPADQVGALETALRTMLAGGRSASVSLGGLGMFPNRNRPRVVWVGVGGEVAAIADLQRRVEAATVPLGFPSEQRPFSPHLTLARVREELGSVERRTLGELIAGERYDVRLAVPVREVSLMRSELRRGGARYSRLAAVELVE